MEVCFGENETRHRSEGLTKKGGRKGQDMKKWTGMITNLTMLTQFGLSLVTPLFLCLALCWWLCDRFSVGTWIYLIGFFFRHRRRCRDSLEIRAERSAASETHRDGAGRKKEEKAGVFQPTYLERV